MADSINSLQTPLLHNQNQNDEEFVIDIQVNGGGGGIQNPNPNPNPFEFSGVSPELPLPRPSSIDPFKNRTPSLVGLGLYEWVKVVVIVPVALIRLVMFGLALAVGYIATKLALHGWKDRQSPMPRWRSRSMWITRICSRCILFCFG